MENRKIWDCRGSGRMRRFGAPAGTVLVLQSREGINQPRELSWVRRDTRFKGLSERVLCSCFPILEFQNNSSAMLERLRTAPVPPKCPQNCPGMPRRPFGIRAQQLSYCNDLASPTDGVSGIHQRTQIGAIVGGSGVGFLRPHQLPVEINHRHHQPLQPVAPGMGCWLW